MSDGWEKDDDVAVIGGETIDIDRSVDKPRMFKVVLLNDDYTPFDFVQAILQTVFRHSAEAAGMIAKEVHDKGKAVGGIFTHEIAETKSVIVNHQAQESEFPFKTIVEAE